MEGETDLWSAAAVFRGTEEYAAAFDLEVWKAQQQARVRSELKDERAQLQKVMTAEVRKKEEGRLGELDSLRKDLEQMARRLKLREDALQKRISQFESREAAFEARRVKVAEQHEQHLVSLECRTRRQLEESVVQQDVLKAQLSDRDRTIALLEERLRAAEGEYDTLQHHISRVMADDKGKERTNELEGLLESSNTVILNLQLQLKEREADLALVRKERDQFEQVSKLYKGQLNRLTQRYTELQKQWNHRERMLIEDERRKLEEAERRQQLAAYRMGEETKAVHRYELLRCQAAENIAHGVIKGSLPTRHGGDGRGNHADDCQALLKELQIDVKRGLMDLKTKKKKGNTKPREQLVYAEVVPHSPQNIPSPVSDRKAKTTEQVVTHTRRGSNEKVRAGSVSDDAVSTILSSLSHRESENRCERTEPYSSPRGVEQVEEVTVSAREDEPVDMSSSYCYADVESWATDGDERRVMSHGVTRHNVRMDSLPPLLPASMGHDGANDDSDIRLQPLPEDFVQASRAALPPPSRESTRAEMIAFVEKLQANKRKLLDSGVYKETDILIREMTDKITLYEEFLSHQF